MKEHKDRIECAVLGIGSPLVDILIQEEDEFIKLAGGVKGGMELVDYSKIDEMLAKTGSTIVQASGGSASNTIQALAHLGNSVAFLGKVGKDKYGRFYKSSLKRSGVEPRLISCPDQTGRVLSIITPDAQRTMRTFLGSAANLCCDDLNASQFEGVKYTLIEGYLMFNEPVFLKSIDLAKQVGSKVCLDLASFEVVNIKKELLEKVFKSDIDIIFSNEDEAKAFTGKGEEESLDIFSKFCEIAVVKLGKDGAWIKNGESNFRVQAHPVKAIDTTGAGDIWAAGFLHGLLQKEPLHRCGDIAARVAARIVEVVGASLPKRSWKKIREDLQQG
ncbi:MAG: adenosine kinase [bacterium]